MKNTLKKSALTLAIIASFGLTGCLKSNSDPSPETVSLNKTTTGVITGFGSVFINGVEYETDTAAVSIDGVPNTNNVDRDAGLKLGMVVTLSGDAAGGAGTAVSIEFNDEVEGMVTEIPGVDATTGAPTGALKILGTTIITDEDTIFESNVADISTRDQIEIGHIIEVSGYSAGDGVVWATRLELKKKALELNDEVELTGLVSGLTDTTFSIGDMVISYLPENLDADITTLADGMLVEVKSLGLDGDILVAKKIELKSQDKKSVKHDGDDDEVEVEGVITSSVDFLTTNTFDVNGSTIIFDINTRFVHGTKNTITDGYKVKVKGAVDANGDFVAQTIVFKPTGDIKMAGPITSADVVANTVNMFGLTVHLENSTTVEDDTDAKIKYLFGADDLSIGDWLEIKAYKNSNGELVATKMTRKKLEDGKLSKLEGKVNSIDATNSALIVLSGVSVDISATGEAAVLNGKMELKGSYDGTTFIASVGKPAEADEHYIGGEDGEENKEDEKHEDETTESNTHEDDGLEHDDSLTSDIDSGSSESNGLI